MLTRKDDFASVTPMYYLVLGVFKEILTSSSSNFSLVGSEIYKISHMNKRSLIQCNGYCYNNCYLQN